MRRFLTMLCAIFMIVGGVICLFRPISTFLQTGYVIGVIMLFDAIGDIFAWFEAKKYQEISAWYLVSAILSFIFAIILIGSLGLQMATNIVVTYVVAFWVISHGVMRVVTAFRLRGLKKRLPQVFTSNKWIAVLLLGILSIVLGIIFCMRPVVLMGLIGFIMAFAMIVIGANLLTIGTFIY